MSKFTYIEPKIKFYRRKKVPRNGWDWLLKTAVGNTSFHSGMELLRLLNQLLSATQDN